MARFSKIFTNNIFFSDSVSPISTIIERNFRIKRGDSLNYRLPVFSDGSYDRTYFNSSDAQQQYSRTSYILVGSPVGAYITREGMLNWKTQLDIHVSQNMENENNVEYFVVKIVGPCKMETALVEISVYVDRVVATTDVNPR